MAPRVGIWLATPNALVTERHRYVGHLIFEAALGWSAEWCGNIESWQNDAFDLRVQYGGMPPVDSTTWIPDAGLLSQIGPGATWSDWSSPALTPGGSGLPFGMPSNTQVAGHSDWWSWAFWVATRMEEYGDDSGTRDAMGRFKSIHSWAHAAGCLQRPEIEFRARSWAAANTAFEPYGRTYTVCPSIDVDSAFAYSHKGWVLTILAALNDVVRGRWARFQERVKVLQNKLADPYDTYDWLEHCHAQHGLRARYFFLLANRSEHDRGVPWNAPEMKLLVQRLKLTADCGIHPGVAAHDAASPNCLKKEVKRMQTLMGEDVTHSRQHYLLQHFPSSWNRLLQAGIRHDYSLGFADTIGFRSGMSRPFRAYNIEEECITPLWLHPVAVMDATLMRHMALSPDEAVQKVVELAQNVKEVEGVLTLLWHNESVSDRWEWVGWKAKYQEMLEVVK